MKLLMMVVPLTFIPEFDRNDQPGPSNLSPNANTSDIESAPNQTTELLNVSFISNDGNIIETEMTEIENETPIYFMRSLSNLSLFLHHLFIKQIMIMN